MFLTLNVNPNFRPSCQAFKDQLIHTHWRCTNMLLDSVQTFDFPGEVVHRVHIIFDWNLLPLNLVYH